MVPKITQIKIKQFISIKLSQITLIYYQNIHQRFTIIFVIYFPINKAQIVINNS